ncbi:membrane protein [Streptomyces albospinus]|uniref:Membrane protein n=1 Tax=Streptomyces albospinus TaxID=285515 RepID=A0ABQ2V6R3_9ACTN|nr:hypothetical protein [Streptomyces albospinus]GGU67617.1 membrane protein [Streptomyces albospinus]
MGIESDQLVFDYLSRVGDLAQQRGLPSGDRMRLVAALRAEIDAQKVDSVPGVKRVLARLGTPEAVVKAAGSRDRDAPPGGGPSAARDSGSPLVPHLEPEPRAGARQRLGELIGKTPASRDLDEEEAEPGRRPGFLKKRAAQPAVPEAPAASPPHLAGADELGDEEDPPDWWRVEPEPYAAGDAVPGFVGGIEVPEIWERPESEQAGEGAGAASEEPGGDGADGGARRGRMLPVLLRRTLGRRRSAAAGEPDGADGAAGEGEEGAEAVEAAGPVPLRAWLSPVPTLAVLLLVAGAVTGSWLALAGGWGLAYVSRRLSRTETKFAALGVPGIVVGGLVVWTWGRFDGRWGDPIAPGRLGPELFAELPGVVRVAAVASALFLLWRMRRTAG